MNSASKIKDVNEFVKSLEPYNPDQPKDRPRQTVVVGQPAAAATADNMVVVVNPGTLREFIVQIRLDDIDEIADLPAVTNLRTMAEERRVRVALKQGARVLVGVWRNARGGGRHIVKMPARGGGCGGWWHPPAKSCVCEIMPDGSDALYIDELPLEPIPPDDGGGGGVGGACSWFMQMSW